MWNKTVRCWQCSGVADPSSSTCELCSQPLLIGAYRVHSLLGVGSYGSTFLCSRRDELEPNFAVKLFDPALIDVRSATEAVASVTALEHPNIARIIEANPAEGFYATEYTQAGSLADLMINRPSDVIRDFSSFAIAICEGLRAAHVKLIPHRNLKPTNILFSSSYVPMLVDFGPGHEGVRDAVNEQQIESLRHMSPEVILEGKHELVDDIFSLGVIFYRMLCGEYPFTARTSYGVQMKVRRMEYRPLGETTSQTGVDFGDLVARMIAKRDDRIQSVEFARAELTAPVLPIEGPATIDDWQDLIASIYRRRNSIRHPALLSLHLATNVNGLYHSFRGQDPVIHQEGADFYFPRILAWIMALTSAANWRASQIIQFKYSNECPYCHANPCDCKREGIGIEPSAIERAKVLEELSARTNVVTQGAHSLMFYQSMFAAIYAQSNRDRGIRLGSMAARCLSAVVDVQDALKRLPSLEQLNRVDVLHAELADLYAWFFAMVNSFNEEYDLEATLRRLFPGHCYLCGQHPCACREIDLEIKVAKYRTIGR